jgi:hypothetical protein
MCFSAAASFSAAAVCGGIGIATVRRAERPDLMLAFIPMLFSAHQALEGAVWLTGGEGLGQCAGYSFAIGAFCLWPVYIPLAAWISEPSPQLGNAMLGFLLLGAAIAATEAFVLYSGLTIEFAAHHIKYGPQQNYPPVFDYLYALAVLGPLFLYRNTYIRLFGGLVLVFFAVSTLIFNPERTSVWCFFAALSSVVLYFFVASKSAGVPKNARPVLGT